MLHRLWSDSNFIPTVPIQTLWNLSVKCPDDFFQDLPIRVEDGFVVDWSKIGQEDNAMSQIKTYGTCSPVYFTDFFYIKYLLAFSSF